MCKTCQFYNWGYGACKRSLAWEWKSEMDAALRQMVKDGKDNEEMEWEEGKMVKQQKRKKQAKRSQNAMMK